MTVDTRKNYPYETKKQAVELYFEGLSTKEVAERLEIQNPSSIRYWSGLVKEAKSFDVLREKRRGPREAGSGAPKTELEVTKAKLERAELEIMYLKKLIALRKG